MLEQCIRLFKTTYNRFDLYSEKIQQSKGKRIALWIVAILVCFSILLFLNILTPLISDDFAYSFVYGENTLVASLQDIVKSQINHYYMWGGRSVVHFIAQVLLLLPPIVADLLNTLIYMGYVFLIYCHIIGRGKNSISLFILINLAIWFLQPVFGDTILWITGSANYLWGTFFILLFLLPYRYYNGIQPKVPKQILYTILLFLLGIIAGWTNENTAGAMILIVGIFFLYYRSVNWKIPVYLIAGLVGALLGYIVMIMAPGNFERAGESSLNLYLLFYRLFNCTLTFVYYCGPLIIISFLIPILYYRFPNDKDKKTNLIKALIYYIAAFAAVYAMLLSPTFPRRALFGVVTFLIVGSGILFYHLDFRHKFLQQIKMAVMLLASFSFVFTFYLASKDINRYRQMVYNREIVIKDAKEQGKTYCEFDRFDGGTYIHGEDPFSEELMSRYYGIKIKLKNSDN